MQHTRTHKAVTGRVEAKKYSLVEGNQTIICMEIASDEIFLVLRTSRKSNTYRGYAYKWSMEQAE